MLKELFGNETLHELNSRHLRLPRTEVQVLNDTIPDDKRYYYPDIVRQIAPVNLPNNIVHAEAADINIPVRAPAVVAIAQPIVAKPKITAGIKIPGRPKNSIPIGNQTSSILNFLRPITDNTKSFTAIRKTIAPPVIDLIAAASEDEDTIVAPNPNPNNNTSSTPQPDRMLGQQAPPNNVSISNDTNPNICVT